jgi:DNA-binding HxlR family transcriptional regulator
VDLRTAQIVGALDGTAASILLELLEQPSTEADLIAKIGEPSQPTMNRRLERLEHVGLVQHEPGKPKAPGRLWSVVHVDETTKLLDAMLLLSDVVEATDAARRRAAARRLKRARASRLGLKLVKDDGRRRKP